MKQQDAKQFEPLQALLCLIFAGFLSVAGLQTLSKSGSARSPVSGAKLDEAAVLVRRDAPERSTQVHRLSGFFAVQAAN